MKSKRSKATDIPAKVKLAVWERDGHRCIICGSTIASPNAHYVSRAHGGLGIEQNIVTLCTTNIDGKRGCHDRYDNSDERDLFRRLIREYLQRCYPDWKEDELVYDKWGWTHGEKS